MDQDLITKLATLEAKIDAVYVSAEKTRRYFLITSWVTILMFVVPLIGIAFAVPTLLSTYTSALSEQ